MERQASAPAVSLWAAEAIATPPVQSPFVPGASGSATAVVVSGGKQYRVAPGDRILVDRVAAELGAELTLDKVLMLADGDAFKVGAEAAGLVVNAKVIRHQRGPKIDVLRYKSKKRVRVHRGARADLTALEIVSFGAPAARKTRSKKTAETPPAETPDEAE
jgi:large subunit ribosomal protein L21